MDNKYHGSVGDAARMPKWSQKAVYRVTRHPPALWTMKSQRSSKWRRKQRLSPISTENALFPNPKEF
jgi:hypothetical protein